MSRFNCRDFAENTSALGSKPDSMDCTSVPPGPLLQARPPAMLKSLLSQLFHVAKPLTLPEKSRSQSPALKPIPAWAVPANSAKVLARAHANFFRRSILILYSPRVWCCDGSRPIGNLYANGGERPGERCTPKV